MTVKLTSMPDLNRKAFDILAKELGLGDTVRFFSQLGLGAGNYSEERQALFAGLTLDEYRQAIAKMPNESSGSPLVAGESPEDKGAGKPSSKK